MKSIQIILLLATISLFTSIPYGAAEARDCSNPKGFHAKMMCKLLGDAETIETKADGFFTKLKNFGGSKVSESDK